MHNPILPGFNPDPSICKKGDDYYLAVSTFEWLPGVPVYHSKDLMNWTLIHNVLDEERFGNLSRLPSAKGVWAPQLSYSSKFDKFYLMYSIMNSTSARHFEVDNFIVESDEITGPWSDPVYVHSFGFDPSLFIEDDGTAYIVSLEWETREGFHTPGGICMIEYDLEAKKVVGDSKRITNGATLRGCVEGPHVYKKNDYYYLLTSEGGTGYGHALVAQRSKNIWGPYEASKHEVISAVSDFDEMYNDEAFKLSRYNPEFRLQKTGHGSIVEVDGEPYVFFHVGRPFLPELRCTMGRESAVAKLRWTEDGWLETDTSFDYQNGDIFNFTENGKTQKLDFKDGIPLNLYTPRRLPKDYVEIVDESTIKLRGSEWLTSENSISFLALKLTSINYEFETDIDFSPTKYQHNAGVSLYYDNMNFLCLNMTYDEINKMNKLEIRKYENSERRKFADAVKYIDGNKIRIGIKIFNRSINFYYYEGEKRVFIGPHFDTSQLSDEFSNYGEFTGTFIGVYCNDGAFRSKFAEFSNITYKEDRENEKFD